MQYSSTTRTHGNLVGNAELPAATCSNLLVLVQQPARAIASHQSHHPTSSPPAPPAPHSKTPRPSTSSTPSQLTMDCFQNDRRDEQEIAVHTGGERASSFEATMSYEMQSSSLPGLDEHLLLFDLRELPSEPLQSRLFTDGESDDSSVLEAAAGPYFAGAYAAGEWSYAAGAAGASGTVSSWREKPGKTKPYFVPAGPLREC
jgi:hypothetical protein